MAKQLDDQEIARLREILHKMADFVALFEATEEKLAAREQALEVKLKASEAMFRKQIEQIKSVLTEFQAIMTEAGAARWRLAAENALKEGQAHLQAMQQTTEEFVQQTKETCARLDRATAYTVKGVSQAVNQFNAQEIRRLADQSCDQINQTSVSVVAKVSDIVKWFHWRNLGMVITLALAVTMFTGLYLNDEWPWESHTQVMKQRNLAQAVINAWSELSPADQQHIIHSAPKAIS